MLTQITDAARRSMAAANREAVRQSHDYVGSLHIIVGLVDASPAARGILERASVDVNALRAMACKVLATTQSTGAAPAIKEASKLAQHFKSTAVDAPHVLLGALTVADESVIAVFEAVGADINDARRILKKYLEDISAM